MTDNDTQKTALVTGATSGIGFEAAAQLAESGYARVTITGRNAEGAEEARAKLVTRTGREVFETLAVDLDKPQCVNDAADELAHRGHKIDFLLLNAGILSGSELLKTDQGVERTFAPLIGHHLLTMRLLEDALLSDKARIVIASSEAARGDVPMMNPVDLPDFAAKHHEGDLAAAAEAVTSFEGPLKYKSSTAYATTKLFVAYWSAALARKLPTGMTVDAVSPRSAVSTNTGRNANFFMRHIMMPLMKIVPGMSGPVSEGAARYIEAAGYSEEVNGHSFASAPKKMIGPLHKMEFPHVIDQDSQEATWDAIVRVARWSGLPSHRLGRSSTDLMLLSLVK